MVVQSFFAGNVSPAQYDAFLAEGWFRDCMMMYRSDLVVLDREVYEILHVRSRLEGFHFRKSQAKLMHRIRHRFRVEVGSAGHDEQRTALYAKQIPKFRGFIHPRLGDFLMRPEGDRIPMMEVAVYDGPRLIAVSYFDVGERSVASLIGLYDPEYSRYSLGYFTMLCEVEWAVGKGLSWYYPGYIFDLESAFDYKLRIGNVQTLVRQTGWTDGVHRPQDDSFLGFRIRRRMSELEALLTARGIRFRKRFYPQFTAARMMNFDKKLFSLPVFFEIRDEEIFYAACYEPETDHFLLKRMESAKEYTGILGMPLSRDYHRDPVYVTELLKETSSMMIFPEHLRDEAFQESSMPTGQ
jgi:leucyl-tRNA---protein transferase